MARTAASHPRPFTVTAADGTRLAASAAGDPARPPVLLVHGYPDTAAVWDVVAKALVRDHHVLRYDSRGAGGSERPTARGAYTLAVLAADARAVVRAAGVDRPVHLVGHDWGSVTGWEAVTSPGAAEWIASFTTVSGPCLEHVAHWTRDRLRRPTPGRLLPLVRQQAKSWYLAAFQIPGVAEVAWRRRLGAGWNRRLERTEGIAAADSLIAGTLTEDAVAGLNIYRANVWPAVRGRPDPRPSAVPVQFVVPLRDRYVGPDLAGAGLPWAAPAWWRTVDTGHWGALITSGAELAGWIRELVQHLDGAPAAPALAAARLD